MMDHEARMIELEERIVILERRTAQWKGLASLWRTRYRSVEDELMNLRANLIAEEELHAPQ